MRHSIILLIILNVDHSTRANTAHHLLNNTDTVATAHPLLSSTATVPLLLSKATELLTVDMVLLLLNKATVDTVASPDTVLPEAMATLVQADSRVPLLSSRLPVLILSESRIMAITMNRRS